MVIDCRMAYSWEKLGEGRDATHLLTVNGVKSAVVWFHGGFVERPDSWQLKIRDRHDTAGYASLTEAKQAAELTLIQE
jgi:hypothetical protein